MQRFNFHPAIVLLAATLAAPAAFAQSVAVDHAIPIDQDSALAGGVGGGSDLPGFPVTITKSGSYRLASNLVVPAGVDGIEIAEGIEAVIDLNGFSIVGSAVCSASTNCFSLNGNAGVRVPQSAVSHVTVANGRIRGFSWAGIGCYNPPNGMYLVGSATVDNVHLLNNGSGLRVGRIAMSRVRAEANSGAGVQANFAAISDTHAYGNGGSGIVASRGSVRDSTAASNGGVGFSAGSKLVLHHNAADGNANGSASGGVQVAGSNAF